MFQTALSQSLRGATLEGEKTRTRWFRPDGSVRKEVQKRTWRVRVAGRRGEVMGERREEERIEGGGEEGEVVEREDE